MPGKRGEEPRFQPDGGWLEVLADLAESIARLLRSLRAVLENFKGLDAGERKAAGAGLVGLAGAAGATAAGYFEAIAAPFWVYMLVALVFQAPWISRALPAVWADSGRRKAIYDGKKHENALQEYFKKTREWRHAWASSLVGPLKSPLETCEQVGEVMESAVEDVADFTGYSLTLVLVVLRNGHYEIVLTKGEVSDCLKTGTRWSHGDMNVYEYLDQQSLYPHRLIEREVLGGNEYFLVAVSEIDVIGKVKGSVLDCFVDVVRHGIGRVVAYGDA